MGVIFWVADHSGKIALLCVVALVVVLSYEKGKREGVHSMRDDYADGLRAGASKCAPVSGPQIMKLK